MTEVSPVYIWQVYGVFLTLSLFICQISNNRFPSPSTDKTPRLTIHVCSDRAWHGLAYICTYSISSVCNSE
jgi:hypothetical protein